MLRPVLRPAVRAAVLVVAAALAGCTTYGSRQYDVVLHSEPPGADAYLVKYTQWEKGDGPALLEAWYAAADPDEVQRALDALLRHVAVARVTGGATPVAVEHLVAHEHLYLAVKDGWLATTRFVPRPEHKGDPTVALAPHPAADPQP